MKAGQSSSSPMHFEMAQRKGKAVVDADQRRYVFGQSRDKPFGDATPRPVFARARSVASPRLVAMIDLPCECSWYEHRHTSAWCCPGQHRNLGAVLIPSPNSDSTEIWGNLTAAGAAMTHRLSRGELYDLVWSQPMQRLAKQFGISDVALAKTCRRAENSSSQASLLGQIASRQEGHANRASAARSRGVGRRVRRWIPKDNAPSPKADAS